jgi:hypothetical protein
MRSGCSFKLHGNFLPGLDVNSEIDIPICARTKLMVDLKSTSNNPVHVKGKSAIIQKGDQLADFFEPKIMHMIWLVKSSHNSHKNERKSSEETAYKRVFQRAVQRRED